MASSGASTTAHSFSVFVGPPNLRFRPLPGLADELLAPNYVNRAMGLDLAGFKAMGAGLGNALSDIRFEIENLVAEGDAVVLRFTMEGTHTGSLMGEPPSGKRISARGLTYYSLAR